MNVDFRDLKKLQKRLKQAQNQVPELMQQIVDEISNEFLQNVIQRTPTTNNNKLKNNWKKRVVANENGTYTVEVYNDLEYASLVEYGSKNGNNGWNEGKFMMTITSQMIQRRMNSIIQPKLDNFLKGVFK